MCINLAVDCTIEIAQIESDIYHLREKAEDFRIIFFKCL